MIENGQGVATLSLVHVVRRDQYGGAARGQGKQTLPEIAAALRIDSAGGFIEHQQGRLMQRCCCQRQALLLAAAERAGRPIKKFAETVLFDHRGHAPRRALRFERVDAGHELQILART